VKHGGVESKNGLFGRFFYILVLIITLHIRYEYAGYSQQR